jgi:hypothetical protein
MEHRFQRFFSTILALSVMTSVAFIPSASADHDRDDWGRFHNRGRHLGWVNNQYDRNDFRRYNRSYSGQNQWLGWKGQKVVKGAAVGAGVGAAAGALTDRSILKGALLGSAVGAGAQAIRYSNWW